MSSPILQVVPLGAPPWPTLDPFLFCVHHLDRYPAGDDEMGLSPEHRRGRDLGMDFSGRDGFSMYHGEHIPGFPAHPHRGFETVTIARAGFIDHSDSLGATARFGNGDVQWMTAGKGIVHCEMFPLRDRERGNDAELFQLWLNLPKADKLVDPHFKMLWGDTIPERTIEATGGARARVRVVAGSFDGADAPTPPPHSWAARPESGVMILTAKLDEGARLTIPASAIEDVGRVVYFFDGGALRDPAGGRSFGPKHALVLDASMDATLEAERGACELLVLQGRPIGEPIAQHGPFVMNTRTEILEAYEEYQRTRFGGWPWEGTGPVHPRERGRFAKHADGHVEERSEG